MHEPYARQQNALRLTVDEVTAEGRIALRLTDASGAFLASNVAHASVRDPRWKGLLQLDRYLEVHRARGMTVEQLLGELGDFLSTCVLGSQITRLIFESPSPRVLFVEVPGERRSEAAELVRVPWELARNEQGNTLLDTGSSVQILPHHLIPSNAPLESALADACPFVPDGALRVLLVFAQTRHQTALAMRELRERLHCLLLGDVAPRYNVAVRRYPGLFVSGCPPRWRVRFCSRFCSRE